MKRISFLCALALLLLFTQNAAAQSPYADPLRAERYTMADKLQRGAVNVLTFWGEVPRNVAREWEKTDPGTAFFVGGFKGLALGFGRLVTGVYEVVTFPVPFPNDFGPIMEPEYVVPDPWGAGVPGVTEPLPGEDPLLEPGPLEVDPWQYP